MKYTYAFLVKYRYYIFWSLTVLLITEVVQPLIGIVSFEHERIFVWISFPTLLAWMGIAVLIGIVSPVDHRTLALIHLALAVFLVVICMNLGLIVAGIYWNAFWDNGLPILLWIGLASLTGAIASPSRNTKVHLMLVIFPLFVASWTGLLMFITFDVPNGLQSWLVIWALSMIATTILVGTIVLTRAASNKLHSTLSFVVVGFKTISISTVLFLMLILLLFVALFVVVDYLPHLTAIIVALAGAVWVGTIRHPVRRKIIVAVIGLWAMIVVMGSYWVWTIDNGLEVYVGEERTAAESAYSVERYAYCNYEPTEFRVVKDDRGWFQLIPYTFWRLPGKTCKHYFHWNGVAG